MAIKYGETLPASAATRLVNDLVACEQPALTPTGKQVFIRVSPSFIDKLFGS
jgi:DNA mismatch repair ATPase MutL